MTVDDDVTRFVREALAAGSSRAEVEDVLLRAGWRREVVRDALSGFAALDFRLPVPKPRPYLSAREAFLYLVLFTTLYISAFNVGALVFQFINRAFPDPAARFGSGFSRESVRWALSSIIVAFPVFLYVSGIVNRSMRDDPAKRESKVRRWLTYVTLFIAAIVLIGNFTYLVFSVLGGELTVRFVLKSLTIAAIAGAVFLYYLGDLKSDEPESAR